MAQWGGYCMPTAGDQQGVMSNEPNGGQTMPTDQQETVTNWPIGGHYTPFGTNQPSSSTHQPIEVNGNHRKPMTANEIREAVESSRQSGLPPVARESAGAVGRNRLSMIASQPTEALRSDHQSLISTRPRRAAGSDQESMVPSQLISAGRSSQQSGMTHQSGSGQSIPVGGNQQSVVDNPSRAGRFLPIDTMNPRDNRIVRFVRDINQEMLNSLLIYQYTQECFSEKGYTIAQSKQKQPMIDEELGQLIAEHRQTKCTDAHLKAIISMYLQLEHQLDIVAKRPPWVASTLRDLVEVISMLHGIKSNVYRIDRHIFATHTNMCSQPERKASVNMLENWRRILLESQAELEGHIQSCYERYGCLTCRPSPA